MPKLDIKKSRKRKTGHTWKSDELFYALINTTTEALIAIDENNKIFLFNPAAEKLFGRDTTEIMGKNLMVHLKARQIRLSKFLD